MKTFLSFLLLLINLLTIAQSQGPNNGGTFANVAIGGSSATWNNPNQVATSDNLNSITNNSLGNGQYSDYIQVTNFGFSIPAGATINGIKVEVEYFDNGTSGKAKDNRVRIVKGGVIGATDRSIGASWPSADPNSYKTYGSNADLWGNAWTNTDINSANFGFAISAKRSGGAGTSFPAIDHIRITVYYTTVLPIELLSFEAFPKINFVLLKWSTASEINNDYFTIEKSSDAIYFEVMITITGAGNSTSIRNYSVIDTNPYHTVSYYRLRQTDYDGKTEISPTIAIALIDYIKDLKVIKITNILGEEITEDCDCIKVYYYNDGSIVKKYKVLSK